MTAQQNTTATTARPVNKDQMRDRITDMIAGVAEGERMARERIQRDNYIIANDVMFAAHRDLARARALADMIFMTDGETLDEDTLHNTSQLLVELLDAVKGRLDDKPAEATTA